MKAPNRVVAVVAAVMSLSLAVLPVVGNFDWTSTAGVLAGVVAVLAVAHTWLIGWQKHEGYQFEKHLYAVRTAAPDPGPPDPPPLAAPVPWVVSASGNTFTGNTASGANYFADVTAPTDPPEEQPPLLPGEDGAELAAWREHAAHESPPLADPTLPLEHEAP